jgi:antiviral helicase SLH1
VRSLVKFPSAAVAESMSLASGGVTRVNVKLMSDSYPGMQWALPNVEVEVTSSTSTQSVEPSSSVSLKE